MIAPPGYPKTVWTPSLTSASQMIWEPVRVFGPVEVGWGSVMLCSGAATARLLVSGSWLLQLAGKKAKSPRTFGVGGLLGGPVVPSAGRRPRANKPEREGNDDNDDAHIRPHRRRQLRRAGRTDVGRGRHEESKVLRAFDFVKHVCAHS